MRFTPRFRFSGEIRRIRKYGGKRSFLLRSGCFFNFFRSGMTVTETEEKRTIPIRHVPISNIMRWFYPTNRVERRRIRRYNRGVKQIVGENRAFRSLRGIAATGNP